jgi:hypothetical protein
MGGCERRGMSSPHLQLGLIRSPTKRGRRHSMHEAPAEEPLVTLFDMVGI